MCVGGKELILNIKQKVYEKRWFLVFLLFFWIYIIIVHNPFDISKGTNGDVIYGDSQKGITYEITDKQSISQSFIANYNQMKTVNVLVATCGRTNNGEIEFNVVDDKGVTVGKYTTDMSEITDNSKISIPISGVEKAKGKQFTLSIKSKEAKEGNAIVVYKGNSYKGTAIAEQNSRTLDGTLCMDVEYYIFAFQILKIVLWILGIISSIVLVIIVDGANEKSFMIIAIATGVAIIFSNTFVHPLDESTHFFRSFMISQGDFLDCTDSQGNIGGWVSENYNQIMSQQLNIKNYLLNHEIWNQPFSKEKVFVINPYMSSVTPLNHAVAAIGVFIGRLINAPAIVVIILGRVSDLTFYICFCYAAIKNSRYYKTLFFTAALVPYGLWLAGSFSIDPILIGASLMFLSISLKYYFDDSEDVVKTRDIILLLISGAFIASVKYLVYTPILLTFFLIPKKKFKKKQWVTVLLLAIILIGIMALVQLKLLSSFKFTEDRNGDVDVARQIKYIISDFGTVFRNILNYFVESQLGFFEGMTPRYGSETVRDLIGLFLIFGAAFEIKRYEFSNKNKKYIFILLMLFIFATIYLLTTVSLYLGFTPVGKFDVEGVQPRYFVPVLIFLMIPMSFVPIKNNIKRYSEKVAFIMLLGQVNMFMGLLMDNFV